MPKADYLTSQLPIRYTMIRLDDLENGYYIYQDTDAFCFGIDAVLLAHFGKLKNNDRVLDLCTGNGIVPLLMHAVARDDGLTVRFDGLEIQAPIAQLATKSVCYNKLEESIAITTGDLREAATIYGPASFSVVTCNPPYMKARQGLRGETDAKTIARHEVMCTLEEIILQSSKVLKSRGRFIMVHRPARLAEIFAALHTCHLEPKRMQLVYPYVDKAPTMVLIEAVKGGGPQLNVEPPLIVYNADRSYTEQVLRIYGKVR